MKLPARAEKAVRCIQGFVPTTRDNLVLQHKHDCGPPNDDSDVDPNVEQPVDQTKGIGASNLAGISSAS